jgi:hypothetical protein
LSRKPQLDAEAPQPARKGPPLADANTDNAQPTPKAGHDRATSRTLWVTAGVSVFASLVACAGAWYSADVAKGINSDELAFRRSETAAARKHEKAQELGGCPEFRGTSVAIR